MTKLTNFGLEATLGGVWVDLSDGSYVPHAESFGQSAKQWRRITATSPVLDGDYLVHATLGMVQETVQIWCYGQDQVDLANLYTTLEAIFDQLDFRVRLTFDDFRETWQCQASDYTLQRGQVYTHNCMALFAATVPRFPSVAREEIL